METSPVRQILQQALSGDQKIQAAEFAQIKQAIEADGQVNAEEVKLLVDALTQNQLDGDAVAPVIDFVAKHQNAPASKPVEPAAPTPSKAPEASKEEPSHWKNTYTVQGNFNHTTVSDGWTGQYGDEKTATRIEGSLQADFNYEKDRLTWKNRILTEYGNTFVKGQDDRVVSRNNLEITSEAGRVIERKDNYKIEIPYASVYTKGPLTELDGRKFRETSGAKITYTPTQGAEYSMKVGAGFQQTHDPATQRWNNEFGVEVVAEGKQSLGFMKAPVVSATGIHEENVAFLDRLEAQVQVNAFNPLQNGFAVSNTDIGVKVGARYYLTEKKNVWVGAGQQWEYGGKQESTWESKFSADAGFKFD